MDFLDDEKLEVIYQQHLEKWKAESEKPRQRLSKAQACTHIINGRDLNGDEVTFEDCFNSEIFNEAEEEEVWEADLYASDPDDYSDPETEPYKCLVCGRMAKHKRCLYLKRVPHGVTLPPGVQRVCKCHGERDGGDFHNDLNWEGRATFKRCRNCNTIGDHWADEPMCPKHQPGSVPARECTSPPIYTC